jgi:hypothetical protein
MHEICNMHQLFFARIYVDECVPGCMAGSQLKADTAEEL